MRIVIDVGNGRKPTGIVTIDGTAGSGKTTAGSMLASKVECPFLSTGLIYRAMGWLAITTGMDIHDETQKIIEHDVEIIVKTDGVFVGGRQVYEELYNEDVEKWASRIAGIPEVKHFIKKYLRELSDKNIIVEGRDTGTFVFPDANIKFFLTARLDERATRSAQRSGKYTSAEILMELEKRDKEDRLRETGPLSCPVDAIVIDTTHLSPQEVVNMIEFYLKRKMPECLNN